MVICAHAQNPNKLIRQGNSAYTDSSFAAAEESYRTALAADQNSFNAAFNLADAIYKQENYEEASTLFKGLTSKAESKKDKAMAYHNLGNSLLQEGKLEESIEAYKNSLRNNPSDKDTKHNLAYVQRMKQEQEQNQEEKEEEKQEEKQEEQEQKDKEKQEEQQSNNQNQEQQPQEEQKPKEAKNPNQISKEEAEKMLEALQQQEKELQKDLQKKKAKGVKLKIEKDW